MTRETDGASATRVRGLILAGGKSSRFGSDKALAVLHGRPLLQHVIDRLAPQVETLAINAPPDPRLVRFGLPVVPDLLPTLKGPLAGLYTAFASWPTDETVIVAVDLPCLPRDLVARLRAGAGTARCAYATDGRRHALALWCAAGALPQLEAFLARGGTRLGDWLAHAAAVRFAPDADGDVALNINTPADLARAAARCR